MRSRFSPVLVAATALLVITTAALPSPTIALFSTARIQQLSHTSAATRGDCLAAVAALALGRNAPADPAVLTRELANRNIVRDRDLERLGEPASRGFACLLVKRAIHESGGLLTSVFADSEHYAYNHLQFLGLIPSGSSWVSITGPELVSLVSLSKKYVRGRKAAGPEEAK